MSLVCECERPILIPVPLFNAVECLICLKPPLETLSHPTNRMDPECLSPKRTVSLLKHKKHSKQWTKRSSKHAPSESPSTSASPS